MKNKLVKVITVFVVFLLLLVLYFFLKSNNKETDAKAEETADTTEVLSVAADDIASLKFRISNEEKVFTKKESVWSMDADPKFPVKADQMTVLTDALQQITATRTLEKVQDLGEYGLKEPLNQITVTKTDGNQSIINVGNTNDATGDCYIYLDDKKESVYTVDGDLATVFAGSLLNYAEETSYPTIVGSDIFDIKVEKKEEPYHLQKSEDASSGWAITDGDGNQKEADTKDLGTLQSAIAGFTYTGYYEYNCNDMSQYGLEEPEAVITAKYMTTEGESEDESKQVENEIKIFIGDEDGKGNRYIRVNDSKEVHAIAADTLKTTLEGKATGYENKLIANVLKDEVQAMDVTMGNETYTIHSETDEEETLYYIDNKKLEHAEYNNFYSKITALEWQELLDKEQKISEDSDLTLLFHLKDGKTRKITCAPLDTNFYAVSVDSKEQYLVNKMKIKELIELAKELSHK